MASITESSKTILSYDDFHFDEGFDKGYFGAIRAAGTHFHDLGLFRDRVFAFCCWL